MSLIHLDMTLLKHYWHATQHVYPIQVIKRNTNDPHRYSKFWLRTSCDSVKFDSLNSWHSVCTRRECIKWARYARHVSHRSSRHRRFVSCSVAEGFLHFSQVWDFQILSGIWETSMKNAMIGEFSLEWFYGAYYKITAFEVEFFNFSTEHVQCCYWVYWGVTSDHLDSLHRAHRV